MRAFIRKQSFFYVNIALLFFLLNGLCARAACRLDLSRDQINSVSKSTARVFRSLKEPVLLEAYISKEVTGEITSELQPILSILYEMERIAEDKLKLRVYDPNDEELRDQARERGIQGIPIAQQKEIEASVRLGYFGIYLQKGEESVVIPLINQNWFIRDLEYRILRELKRFERKGEKSSIGIAQIKGSPEIYAWTRAQDQNKDNLYGFKSSLEKEFGAVDRIHLDAPVPNKIRTLLLVGLPQFEEKESYYLDQFLLRGGNLVCMLSAFTFQMRAADPRLARFGLASGMGGSLGMATVPKEDLKKLNEWLINYGMSLRNEILFEPAQPMAVWDFQGQFPRQILYPAWAIYARQTENIVGDHPALESIEQLVFPWFSSLDIQEARQTGLKFQTLVQSSVRALSLPTASLDYLEVQKTSQNAKNFLGRQAPVAVLASGKFKSAFASSSLPKGVDRALHLKEQAKDTSSHLAAIGTSYLVSDILLRNQLGANIFSLNKAFLLNLIEAMAGDSELAAARSRQRTLSTLIVKSKLAQNMISWSFSLLLPLSLGLWGAWRLKERSKKRGL